MSPRRTKGEPAYELVAAVIRKRIFTGEYRAGQKMTSIPKLAKELGVAPATVQAAQNILKAEGVLEGAFGSGVIVRQKEPLVVSAASYIEPTPGRFSYELIEVGEVVPPSRVTQALGQDPDAERPPTAILRHRKMLFEDVPVELSWSYYPLPLVGGTALTQFRKIRGGAPRILTELGYPPHEFVDRISVRPPDKDERETLGLPQGVNVLQQFRTILTTDGLPVEVSILVKGGHRYELEIRGPGNNITR